jgi:predicted alpha/beta superfamily hydrolase
VNSAVLHSYGFSLEPPITMRPDGYPSEMELRVALPRTYGESDRDFPVLWVTDNDLEAALPMMGDREIIAVGVGAPRIGPGYHIRRTYDFYPEPDILPREPFRGLIERNISADDPALVGGGAAAFLKFLIDDAREVLSSRYRMDPDDHAIEGFSAGGFFVVYALFSRPGAFAKYVASAPALYWSNDLIWQLEAAHAETHDDLKGALFLGTGEGEMTGPDSVIGCFSSMARLAEILTARSYPSFGLNVRGFAGETHTTVRPLVIGSAMRTLWGSPGRPR